MAYESAIFDAAGSNADGSSPGSPLLVGPGTPYGISEHSYPAPPQSVMYAGGVDTEGEAAVSRRYGNRTITLKFTFVDRTGALLTTLQGKFAKFQREGGTLKRTMKNGDVRIYDVIAADGWSPAYNFDHYLADVVVVEMTLPAAPLSRGLEADLGDNVETALPALVFSEASVPGDASALGRLVIDNDSAADWWELRWGAETDADYNIAAATAALFYEAESRTPASGAAVATVAGASGGASNNAVAHFNLLTTYQAVLSTRAASGGAHLTHAGTFRVFARVGAVVGSGAVDVALEWSPDDATRWTRNDAVSVPTTVSWTLVDLGLVAVSQGRPRWEGRLLARSALVPGGINVDWIALVPVNGGYGVARAIQIPTVPTAYLRRDEFIGTTAAAALNGRTAPSGQLWATSGATTDLAFADTPMEAAARSTTSDSGFGRHAVLAGSIADVEIGVKAMFSTVTAVPANLQTGVMTRWASTGASNSARFTLSATGVAAITVSTDTASTTLPVAANTWYELRFSVSGTRYVGWVLGDGRIITRIEVESSALTTGQVGLIDWHGASTPAVTRYYRDFWAAAPALDAACYAGRSVRITHQDVQRQDATSTYARPGSYNGGYLRVPPSGAEGRATRVIVLPSRMVLGADADAGADDISARLFVTPRYLT